MISLFIEFFPKWERLPFFFLSLFFSLISYTISYIYFISFISYVVYLFYYFLPRFWLRSLLLANHPWARTRKISGYHCVAIRIGEIWHPVMFPYTKSPKISQISQVSQIPKLVESFLIRSNQLPVHHPWFVSHWMRHTSKVFSGPVQDADAVGSSPLENK